MADIMKFVIAYFIGLGIGYLWGKWSDKNG